MRARVQLQGGELPSPSTVWKKRESKQASKQARETEIEIEIEMRIER